MRTDGIIQSERAASGYLYRGRYAVISDPKYYLRGVRRGRDSEWVAVLDEPLSDGCSEATPRCILGVNTGHMLTIDPLTDFINKRCSYLTVHERMILISDGYRRLKDTGR